MTRTSVIVLILVVKLVAFAYPHAPVRRLARPRICPVVAHRQLAVPSISREADRVAQSRWYVVEKCDAGHTPETGHRLTVRVT